MVAPRKSMEPWVKDEVQYYDHQIEGIRKMAYLRSFLLADDMGLGKTLQALTVFAIDVVQCFASKAIVICPVTLKGNWMDEIDAFTRFPAIELGKGYKRDNKTPKSLGKAEREKQLDLFDRIPGPKILVVNYEQVQAHLPRLKAMGFDVAIFDEAHYLKNPEAKRTKACMELTTRRSFLLTGSPMLNKVNELWPILWRIDPVAYPHYYSFKQRYCVMGGYKNKEIVGVQNEQELTMRLQSVMIRRLKDDVLNLKKPQIIQRKVDLSDRQQEMYDEAINEMRITLPSEMTPLDIENGMTKFLRLKQICGTTATLLGPDEDHSLKLDLAIQDAVEIVDGGHKLIVFTQFREVQAAYIRRIQAAIPNTPVWVLHGDVPITSRQDVVKAWSSHPGPAIIVCMLQVAGIGLNMTAARHMQFIDKLFVPKLNQQAVDRAHRIGQDTTQSVQVFEYITRNTVENRVEQILKTKTKLFDDVIETSSWKRTLLEEVLRDA